MPVLRMLAEPADAVRARAERLAGLVGGDGRGDGRAASAAARCRSPSCRASPARSRRSSPRRCAPASRPSSASSATAGCCSTAGRSTDAELDEVAAAVARARRMSEGVLWDLLPRRAGDARRSAIVAELGVADALAGGPAPVAELAGEVGADPDTLDRYLRALASDGVFAEDEPGVFAQHRGSELLARGTRLERLRAALRRRLAPRARARLRRRAGFEQAFDGDFWDWLAEHPHERALFDLRDGGRQGAARRAARRPRVARRRDRRRRRRRERLAAARALRTADPGLRGIVFDLPETVRDEAALAAAGIEFVAGSFFERVPRRRRLRPRHDPPRLGRRARPPRSCARSAARAPGRARVLILDGVVAAGNEPHGASGSTCSMLALFGGRERTEAQWRALLEAAGLRARRGRRAADPGDMPLTVGTAGHIDHGKTWLVRALTGKDTDRLPEEQRARDLDRPRLRAARAPGRPAALAGRRPRPRAVRPQHGRRARRGSTSSCS